MVKGHGLLMDTADGCYGQIQDHFGSQTIVDEVVLQTKVVFITHIHGDHQLGILKLLHERDKLITASGKPSSAEFDLYLVTPSPLVEWLELYIKDSVVNR